MNDWIANVVVNKLHPFGKGRQTVYGGSSLAIDNLTVRARWSKQGALLAPGVNKSPAVFISIRALDDLSIENTRARRSLRGKIEGL